MIEAAAWIAVWSPVEHAARASSASFRSGRGSFALRRHAAHALAYQSVSSNVCLASATARLGLVRPAAKQCDAFGLEQSQGGFRTRDFLGHQGGASQQRGQYSAAEAADPWLRMANQRLAVEAALREIEASLAARLGNAAAASGTGR